MNFLRKLPVSLMLGSGAALGALVLTSLMPAPTAAASAPLTVCYSFSTIDQGQYSGFGYYCGGTGGSSGGSSSSVAPPCYADVAMPEVVAIIRNECAWIDFWT